jgi:hypothetical protein
MNATRAVRLLAYWKIYRSNEKRAVRIAIVEAVDADSAIKIRDRTVQDHGSGAAEGHDREAR